MPSKLSRLTPWTAMSSKANSEKVNSPVVQYLANKKVWTGMNGRPLWRWIFLTLYFSSCVTSRRFGDVFRRQLSTLKMDNELPCGSDGSFNFFTMVRHRCRIVRVHFTKRWFNAFVPGTTGNLLRQKPYSSFSALLILYSSKRKIGHISPSVFTQTSSYSKYCFFHSLPVSSHFTFGACLPFL